jgi:hypothetical protein
MECFAQDHSKGEMAVSIEFPMSFAALAQECKLQVWLGSNPPPNMTALNLWSYPNLRAPSEYHGKYATVWVYEVNLGRIDARQVDLVLDEAIRLLAKHGCIVFRFRETRQFSIFQLKHFLGRRYGVRVRVESEFRVGKDWCVKFEIEREDWQRYQQTGWTFGILTQGVRVDNLQAFFESLRSQEGGKAAEILVCGPRLPQFEHFGLRYLDVEVREDLAEICKKKNEIALAATQPNLCLLHDRYRLEPGFFEGFAAYGYDFDYLTVTQRYENGAHFPDYCALSKHELTWNTSLDCVDINYVLPRQYINGGVLIVKTATFRDIPLNELIFWNQAEDVELGKAYRDRSLPPRCNSRSSMVTMGIDAAYTRKILPYYANPSWVRLWEGNSWVHRFMVRTHRRWKYKKK